MVDEHPSPRIFRSAYRVGKRAGRPAGREMNSIVKEYPLVGPQADFSEEIW